MLHLPVSQSVNIDPHSSAYKWHWRWTSPTVLTDSKLQMNSHHHKTAVCPESYIITDDTTKRTMFVDRKRGEREEKERTSHTFSSFLPSQCCLFFVWVWLCGVMINTARHGKRRLQWRGLFWCGEPPIDLPQIPKLTWQVPGSQRLAFRTSKKKWLLNHYHLWNHSETAGNGQTDKPGNIVESGT